MSHPLEPLTGEELKAARDIVLASGRLDVPPEALRFAYVGLREPPKEAVRAVDRGEEVAVDRQVRLVLLQGPESDVTEAVVSLTRRAVERWEVVHDVRPPLQIEESISVIEALHANAEWNAALDRRGITDRSLVQIDPWPAGTFGLPHEERRRIVRCLAYLREAADDNGYARPLEGLLAFVDMGRGEVLEVADYGVVPLPPKSGSYYPEDNGPLRTDLKPLTVTQPEGPSFTVDGNLVRWQKWSLRVGMDPLEGLVLWRVGYDDGDRVRPILYRVSVSEMVVPYGHPSPMHAWKSAFDAGEWGLGRMANSLTLGCDCLGEIAYLDNVFSDERGKPHTRKNAICMHEEDYGILWKHVDMVSGRTEVRRSRRLVISSIATVGNYEYGFYWYFYLDGTLQLEVKLSGIMSTMAVRDETPGEHAGMVAPGLAAPYHQHLFNVRLDVEVDGPEQRGLRGRRGARRAAGVTGQPVGQLLRHVDDAADIRAGRTARRRPGAQPDVAHRQPLLPQWRGRADGVQAVARSVTDAVGPPGIERGPARRLRVAQPLGDAVRRRPAPGGGGLPEPTCGRRGAAGLDGAGPPARRHRRRPVAYLRGHPSAAARGLAGHAGRVHGLHAAAVWVLRPQPCAGRSCDHQRAP